MANRPTQKKGPSWNPANWNCKFNYQLLKMLGFFVHLVHINQEKMVIAPHADREGLVIALRILPTSHCESYKNLDASNKHGTVDLNLQGDCIAVFITFPVGRIRYAITLFFSWLHRGCAMTACLVRKCQSGNEAQGQFFQGHGELGQPKMNNRNL